MQSIDAASIGTLDLRMPISPVADLISRGKVVGSFGSAKALSDCRKIEVFAACDLVEIRLDVFRQQGVVPDRSLWSQLSGIPLLFTARRQEEGGASPLDAAQRADLLRLCFDEAALIDVEVASISEMKDLLEDARKKAVPWIASYHDFEKLPDSAALKEALVAAKEAGAAVFKAAARLSSPADLARLADFQLENHGIPVATMGMGPLAPASRLLCAQCGSVLNYGFLGETATAPGQWPAELLRRAISGSDSI